MDVLGRGSYGQAVLMRNRAGVQLVAKRLRLDGIAPAEAKRIETEVAIYARLRHPNIVHYLGTTSWRETPLSSEMLLICLE